MAVVRQAQWVDVFGITFLEVVHYCLHGIFVVLNKRPVDNTSWYESVKLHMQMLLFCFIGCTSNAMQ